MKLDTMFVRFLKWNGLTPKEFVSLDWEGKNVLREMYEDMKHEYINERDLLIDEVIQDL